CCSTMSPLAAKVKSLPAEPLPGPPLNGVRFPVGMSMTTAPTPSTLETTIERPSGLTASDDGLHSIVTAPTRSSPSSPLSDQLDRRLVFPSGTTTPTDRPGGVPTRPRSPPVSTTRSPRGRTAGTLPPPPPTHPPPPPP